MSKSGLELKVGVFVAICLILLAALMVQFSKGTTFFRPYYILNLKTPNAGTLKPRATVLMAGVQIGWVTGIDLDPDGKSVTLHLLIYKEYQIHKDARFTIEQSGFLGDQYVAIYPESNTGPVYQPNDVATTEAPFNIQEVARQAAGFIQRVDQTVARLNDIIGDVRRDVLNDQTLTNLAFTIGTLRQVSDDAMGTVSNVNVLVVSNTLPASVAVSNLLVFSQRLDLLADSAQGIVDTNGPQIRTAIGNVQIATASLTNLLGQAEAGHGLLATLLKDDRTAANISELSSNLAVTTSNLNSVGLWRVIWGPKHRHTGKDGK